MEVKNDSLMTIQEQVQDKANKYSIEIDEQKLILDIELTPKSLLINIVDCSEVIPVIYQYELTFDYLKEKDSSLTGLGNISKTFQYIKSLIEEKKYSIKKGMKKLIYLLLHIKYLMKRKK